MRHLRPRNTGIAGDPSVPVNRVLAAKLATNADDDGVVFVFLDSFSPTRRRGPVHGCKPQVRPHPVDAAEDPIYAQRGDPCGVVRDDRNKWWMVTWEAQ